jgi:hypothetical protein
MLRVRVNSTTLARLDFQVVEIYLVCFCSLRSCTLQDLRDQQIDIPILARASYDPTNPHSNNLEGKIIMPLDLCFPRCRLIRIELIIKDFD